MCVCVGIFVVEYDCRVSCNLSYCYLVIHSDFAVNKDHWIFLFFFLIKKKLFIYFLEANYFTILY